MKRSWPRQSRITMDSRMLRSVSLLLIVPYLFTVCELKSVRGNHETFDNTVVEWCNASAFFSSRQCEETKIGHSNSLADNIPKDHQDFRYATISHQNVPVLYENSVSNMNLSYLEISFSGLKEIEVGAFNGVTVTSLNISYNNLDVLKTGIFEKTKVLEGIHFKQNGIRTIEDGVFNGMLMSTLELSGNQIEEIFPGAFKGLVVEFISLKGNKIKSIGKEVFTHIRLLELLDLSDNEIQIVEPGAFDKLRKPAFLYMSNNKLEHVPADVFNSHVFMELALDGNNIQTFAPRAFEGTGFVYLNLSYNQIEAIGEDFLNNTLALDHLYLSHNKISSIEPNALDLVSNAVYLDSNNLKVIKNGTFEYVRVMVLFKNKKLKKIEVGAFGEDNFAAQNSYNAESRTLYLEKENLLDSDSIKYLNDLTKSGRLQWFDIPPRNVFSSW